MESIERMQQGNFTGARILFPLFLPVWGVSAARSGRGGHWPSCGPEPGASGFRGRGHNRLLGEPAFRTVVTSA